MRFRALIVGEQDAVSSADITRSNVGDVCTYTYRFVVNSEVPLRLRYTIEAE